MHLYFTMERIFGFKWLNCFGLICCCHYCCSCICRGCNECFECCLLHNMQGNKYNNMDNVSYYANNANGIGNNNDYNNYAARYQFLPRNNAQNERILKSGNDIMINANHPTIASPSISSQ